MVITMRRGATQKEIEGVYEKIKTVNCKHHPIHGTDLTVIAVLGDHTGQLETSIFEVLPGVDKVSRIEKKFKLSARSVKPHGSVVEGVGGKKLAIMAGPCSIESEAQINKCAKVAAGLGCGFLRGGAFKPRTSPFAFQGLKEEGLKMLSQAGKANNMKVVTEVVATDDVSLIAEYADVLQIGARNMQNYRLLEVVGKTGKTILLKRGMAATIDEWLQASDYLLNGGSQVILCERGLRGFDNYTRFTLDVAAVPVVKKLSHLPIIIDPSHAAGNYAYVPSLAMAGVAAGADGLIIEIHPNPKDAMSDGAQSLTFSDFSRLMSGLSTVALAVGRSM